MSQAATHNTTTFGFVLVCLLLGFHVVILDHPKSLGENVFEEPFTVSVLVPQNHTFVEPGIQSSNVLINFFESHVCVMC